MPLIGFDDSPAAAAMGLTTVAQPLREAAATLRRTAHQFPGRSGDDAVARHHVLLAPRLVVRASDPC